jgi:Protein of unknown function (DUF3006)
MASYTIDRFEGSEWAVLEDDRGHTFNVPREWLPHDVREGDLLDVSGVATAGAHLLRLTCDTDGREERRAKAVKRREALPRGRKGDIKL